MKFIIPLICLLAFFKVTAQDDKRFKLKATKYSIAYFDKSHDLVLSLGWQDTSLIIVMIPKEKVIMIYGKTDKIFDVTKRPV